MPSRDVYVCVCVSLTVGARCDRSLALAHNKFTGIMPGCVDKLARLTYFGAWDNLLYGAPPHVRTVLLDNPNRDGDSIWSYNCYPDYPPVQSECPNSTSLGLHLDSMTRDVPTLHASVLSDSVFAQRA